MKRETHEKPLVQVKNLSKYFTVKKGFAQLNQELKAVNNVSFDIEKGETLGVVGESGCGKSTLGRTMLGIYEPTAGSMYYKGVDVTKLKGKKRQPYKKDIQMIFQDPYASLNPRFTIGEILEEPMIIHKMYTPKERKDKVQEILEVVGLKPDHIRRYPYEFSGGQRQRVGIARALILDPGFVVCDEPISALDVSIQVQIINLLEKIQKDRDLSYLFIAHDLGMVRHISQKVAVMYLGQIVEYGPVEDIYNKPLHPYTQALLSAAPVADPETSRHKQRVILEGEIPSPIDVPVGCPFASRCHYAMPECGMKMPGIQVRENRKVACYLYTKGQ